ncbi:MULTISPECIES: FxsA family protein [Bacillaceae]|uniref:FxsA family protein n=1 Tax=Metabacillus sediminis TaxID=3117746 RepID=A0ABZ2NEM8_9BACI|nr:FxsA family protein [Bacillus sp. SJS]KZZ85860.1 exlusion protein FxsA [Bacillus sp. SJS]
MRWLVLLLIAVPALEIGLLIWSGRTLGLIPTVLLIVATGLGGAWLARQQGLETWKKAQQNMNAGQLPGNALIDGICILIGAVLLMTPGFISDVAGFFLLFPVSRKGIKPFILRAIQKRMNRDRITIIR